MFPTRRTSAPLMSRFLDDEWPGYFTWRSTNGGHGNNETIPSVNVREKDDKFIVEVAVPGMRKEDFQVELDNNVLIIRGERKFEEEDKDGDRYISREFSYSTFERFFNLDNRVVDDANIKANYKDGILMLSVPKKEKVKPESAKLIEIH